MRWIVDGYNFIRQVDFLSAAEANGLQAGREALLDFLTEYRQHRPKDLFTVVFDGREEFASQFNRGAEGIQVIFSRRERGETADDAIKKMLETLSNPAETTVVSADRDIIRFARTLRFPTLSPLDFCRPPVPGRRAAAGKPTLSEQHQQQIEKELRRDLGLG